MKVSIGKLALLTDPRFPIVHSELSLDNGMLSSSTLSRLGKVGVKQVVAGKVQLESVAAETLWNTNPVTVIYVVRRPGKC
jgi:hypothetical protein